MEQLLAGSAIFLAAVLIAVPLSVRDGPAQEPRGYPRQDR